MSSKILTYPIHCLKYKHNNTLFESGHHKFRRQKHFSSYPHIIFRMSKAQGMNLKIISRYIRARKSAPLHILSSDVQLTAKMCARNMFITLILLVLDGALLEGCLITNCPRGGKRSEKHSQLENNIKQVSKYLMSKKYIYIQEMASFLVCWQQTFAKITILIYIFVISFIFIRHFPSGRLIGCYARIGSGMLFASTFSVCPVVQAILAHVSDRISVAVHSDA